jgi:hypothetical protein
MPSLGKRHSSKSNAANKRPEESSPPESDDDDATMPSANLKLNTEQKNEGIPKNKWSMEFAAACGNLEYYGREKGSNKPHKQVWLMKEQDTAVFATVGTHLEATITRRPSPYLSKLLELKKIPGDAKINFVVRCNGGCSSGRNHFLQYHEYAGVVIVAVEQILKPIEDKTGNVDEDTKYKETMVFRRVFDTRDAACKAKSCLPNERYMGEVYFRKLHREERATGIETFHEGDTIYKGDIRTLVGIVRWQQAGLTDLPTNYFTEYLDADLLRMGEPVHQNSRA